MKISVCQINTIVGDINTNKLKILEGYSKGVEDKVDLVVFPELALIGYPPLDLIEKEEFRETVMNAANEIAKKTTDVGLLFGSVTEDDDLVGTDVHNSALLCFDGKIQFIQNKTLIPNYDVFDEMRYFDPAKSVDVFEFKGEKLGISICEDIWNDADYWHKRRYRTDPVNRLILKGATILLNISASPYVYRKREDRRKMLSVLTKGNGLPLLYVCYVGGQTELIFDGASMCLNSKGELVKMGKYFEEDYFVFDTKENYTIIDIVERSFEEEIIDAITYGLREYCKKIGFKKVVIGLSGGIDSAIVTYFAVKALGQENVNVIMLPSVYSSEGSITDSEKLIKNLGINSDVIPIQPLFEDALKNLEPIFNDSPKNIAEENLQARIRGLYLMAVSNKFNYLVLATGNKSELAMGYCTLYGDMSGGLSVIGDLYKSEIYALAKYINKDKEIIPNEIITKEPSAELKENQKDQDTLPPYDYLDKVLKMYLEDNKEYNKIVAELGGEKEVRKILDTVDRNEYKRRQAAPALKVSTKAFGFGRRFPIVQGWRKN
ncbi:MAG: NAD+ synthase [Ignavibacteriales bacterium CG12_big_fil_rev_8_21_14_0_65_30_8]|nr:MAG: NAD+ synthase [Ignavibacteriales bacterium CG12_big_fil_rev_8_21_14_0_65_30_8]